MIRQNIDSFVLGIDPYPSWFKVSFADKVSYQTKDNGELLSITIQSPSGTTTASVGDTLMNVQGVLTVVPRAAAERYMN